MNMIRLWAAALCVSLGLTTPVMATPSINDPVVKKDMFALFERNGKTEKYTKLYNKLAEIDPKAQGKVLSFYAEAKGKRPETDVLQGIYSLMRYYRDPSAFYSEAVLDLFPDIGPRYVNVNQSEVDRKRLEALKKETEANKKETEANKKATKLMRELINAL